MYRKRAQNENKSFKSISLIPGKKEAEHDGNTENVL
jgi:hypothetical protein